MIWLHVKLPGFLASSYLSLYRKNPLFRYIFAFAMDLVASHASSSHTGKHRPRHRARGRGWTYKSDMDREPEVKGNKSGTMRART